MSLEIITAKNLKECLELANPETILHSRDVMNMRRDNEKFRSQDFWTADFAMYCLEKGQPILYIVDRDYNHAFNNIEDAIVQIKKEKMMLIDSGKAEEIKRSLKIRKGIRIPLLDLDLLPLGPNSPDPDDIMADQIGDVIEDIGYFEIDVKNYFLLNASQRKLAERVYGKENDFYENMQMLSQISVPSAIGKSPIRLIHVHTLWPHYLEATLRKIGFEKSIGFPCGLDSFQQSGNFSAVGYTVDEKSSVMAVRN